MDTETEITNDETNIEGDETVLVPFAVAGAGLAIAAIAGWGTSKVAPRVRGWVADRRAARDEASDEVHALETIETTAVEKD